MEDKKNYTISHGATRHQESYVIRFDHKEFFVAVKDCKKHHKDYDEMTDFEIVQRVHPYDENKIGEIMTEILKNAKTSNSGGKITGEKQGFRDTGELHNEEEIIGDMLNEIAEYQHEKEDS